MNPNKSDGACGNTKNKDAIINATYLLENFLKFLYTAPLKNNSSAIPTNNHSDRKKITSITGLKTAFAFDWFSKYVRAFCTSAGLEAKLITDQTKSIG